MKKHKSQTPGQASVSNGTAEVFVLPPDLLAKLGINLGNIQHSEVGCPTTSLVKDTEQSTDHSITNSLREDEDASSIIQTANLMKESVFLSPTFFQTAPSATDNEGLVVDDDTNANTDLTISSECDTVTYQCNKKRATFTEINSFSIHSKPQLHNHNILIKPSTMEAAKEIKESKCNEPRKEYKIENQGGNLILTNVPHKIVGKDKISDCKLGDTKDDHPDETALSDCGNSNSRCSPISIKTNLTKQKISLKNKCKEMSEMVTTDPLQLNNCREVTSTGDSVFMPVNTLHEDCNDLAAVEKESAVNATNQNTIVEPVMHVKNPKTVPYVSSDTIFAKRKECLSDDSLSTITECVTSSTAIITECIPNIPHNFSTEKVLQENIELVSPVNKQDSNEASQTNAEFISDWELNFRGFPECNNYYNESESIEHKLRNNNGTVLKTRNEDTKKSEPGNNTDTQEKVKEIAAYLSQITNKKRDVYKTSNENIEKEAKCDPTISKLCVQGVEKPGGKMLKKYIIQNDKMRVSNLKTYHRHKIREKNPKLSEMSDAIMIPDLFQIKDNNNDKAMNGKVSPHLYESCICYDFGNLTYYDTEILYEHIHFWSHKNIECDPETLFGIYNEDYTVLKPSFVEDAHQDVHSDNTKLQDTLCWNEINVLINDEKLEAASSKITAMKTGSSKVQQSITDKAYKKSVTKDNITKSEVKKITCGLCNERFSEMEWEVHKDKHHDSLASETNQKLKVNSATTLPPVTSMKKATQMTDCTESNLNKLESNNDRKSSRSTSAIEVSPKLSVKSVNIPAKICSKLITKALPPEHMVTKTSNGPTVTSKKQSNYTGVECLESSRSARESTLNLVSNTGSLHTTSTKIAKSSGEQITNTDISNKKNNVISRIITRISKDENDALDTRNSTEKMELKKTTKTNESQANKPILENSDNANTLKVCNTTDIKTFIKPIRTVKDLASNSRKSTEEVNTGIDKRVKRSANTVIERDSKKGRIITSSITFDVADNNISKKPPTSGKAGHSDSKKIETKSTFTEKCALPTFEQNLPAKVEIVDSGDIEITIENAHQALENSTECTNVSMNESSIPSNSFVEAVENSTLSSDIATNNDLQSTEYFMVLAPLQESDDLIQCGLCPARVEESEWIKHISDEHDYIAWRDGESPLDLDDEIAIKKHLQGIANRNGGLKCSKCGVVRKFAKKFLDHIRRCNGIRVDQSNVSSLSQEDENVPLLNYKVSRKSREKSSEISLTCGVCNETVEESAWIEHIRNVHKYLAWKSDEQPLDLNNEEAVKQHLKNISKNYDGLLCTCGAKWNYAKKYLKHINECDGVASKNSHIDAATKKPHINIASKSSENDRKHVELELPPVVTCGVCKLEVEGRLWINHIQVAHEYMAWIGGENPLDPDNPEQVKDHLDKIVRAAGELFCAKCGVARRSTFTYLQHVKACAKTGFQIEIDQTVVYNKNEYVCGVCYEKGKLSEWLSHAMSKHYNIAWKVGDIPINLRNPYAVEKYLKVYKKKQDLVCRVCKESRSSCYGFYAHILTCGKSEEEIEAVQDVCEICDNKYLCIYRNQHMAAHRDSDRRRERREMLAKKAEEEALNPPKPPEPGTKRRAAEKAKQGILKLTSNTYDGMPVCGCGATFKDSEEFDQHSCPQKNTQDDESSDVSIKIENESEESADEIVDSGVSDEEDDRVEKKKKRVRVGEGSTKVQRMPYRVTNYTGYLSEAYRDFARLHYTSESLFNEWRNNELTVVPIEETAKYLPQVTESCKIKFGEKASHEWTTLKRFEARKIKGYSMFTGGATQCMAWAPAKLTDESLGYFLAVSPHRGPDVPRCAASDRPVHPASLQIWDFGQFDAMPRCALCIAHEYGIVWAMDWCPSGARDAVPQEAKEATTSYRLGLLAVACSNGSAYVLAVPYPPPRHTHNEPAMYKLKPVAELRLTMTSERRVHQATSIKWSNQKGHSTIIVGYSDGTTALYDLNTESPFLSAQENGVAIFYPFQDRRSECSSVTGVGIVATSSSQRPLGAQFSTSVTGGTLRGAAARPAARVHLAVGGALHSPHWPAVTLAGDIPFMRSVSELEWWGGGRRVGAGRAWAACERCARAASATPPALRLHRQHPIYPEIKKVVVALLLMVPLGAKRKRKVNDDLSVVMEPLTYEDAVAKYGLQLTFVTKSSRSEQLQAQQICTDNEFCPERFPLSDIVALDFCPSGRFHDKIAVATHTGLIFVINI